MTDDDRWIAEQIRQYEQQAWEEEQAARELVKNVDIDVKVSYTIPKWTISPRVDE
jgi:hypothetical protein